MKRPWPAGVPAPVERAGLGGVLTDLHSAAAGGKLRLMKECLLLNIGNTHTQMVRATGTQTGRVERVETKAFLESGTQVGLLPQFPGLPVVAACVVPHAASCLRERWPDRRLLFLEPAMVKDLDFSLVQTRTIGADRLANAVAALEMLKPPFIVLDCGTALSSVVVDADKRFRGGAILPGRRLLRLALHEHTAQLPDVPLQDKLPAAIGTGTAEAILAGTDLAIVGAVQFVLENMRAELAAPECPVAVTGGDAPFFLSAIPNLVATPADFTLRGLARLSSRIL